MITSSAVSYLLLASSQADINPIFAIVFIVFIIAVSMAAVKSGSRDGAKQIRQKYAGQILEEGNVGKHSAYFFTADELLLQKYYAVFAAYRLSDIRYVGVYWDMASRSHVLALMDENNKFLKPADVIGGTRAAQKMYGKSQVSVKQAEGEQFCEILLRHAPHAEKITK